jgi:glutamyl-tRNA synthetase
MNAKVITRIAPSPTGLFHIGTARTALINYLFAQQHQGQFILRIDDTDIERSKPEYTADILQAIQWLGLNYDNIYYQSARTALYKSKLETLLAADKIYWSKEEVKEPGERDQVLRFRNPGQVLKFNDLIRGEIEFDTSDLGDFVVAKDLDTPLYHFASVVDDLDLSITHVIRGEDHISNTPRQIMMLEALGGQAPAYAHLPMILAPDKTKLSKRKHGDIAALTSYEKKGYLPAAVINFISLLGWSPQTGGQSEASDIFSITDLIKNFSLNQIQKSSAIFNLDKLHSLNREYLKKIEPADLEAQALEFLPTLIKQLPSFNPELWSKVLPLVLERISTLGEIADLAEAGELDYFFQAPSPSKELLKNTTHLAEVRTRLNTLAENNFTSEEIKNCLWDFATTVGRGEVLWPMRVALSGLAKSPDPFTLAALLGKTETLTRLSNAEKL